MGREVEDMQERKRCGKDPREGVMRGVGRKLKK